MLDSELHEVCTFRRWPSVDIVVVVYWIVSALLLLELCASNEKELG